MAEKIDKSLDDIIKQTRPGGRGGPRGRRGGQRGGGGAGGQRRGGGGFRAGNFPARRSDGGIQKRRSGGGAGAAGQLSPKKANAASINGQWSHDLYQNGKQAVGGGGANFRRNAITGGPGGPVKLVISNLDFGVNDSDIEGLFQEFGKIRKAAVHYDRSGRSLGTADVLFERKSDAIRALTHYNGVSLDGRPMNIQLTTSLSVFNGGQRQPVRGAAAGVAAGGSGGGGGGAAPRRGGGSGRGGRRRGGGGSGGANRPAKSAADLDADLDAHNAKMQTD